MKDITKIIHAIINKVKKEGDNALCKYLNKFDGISLTPSELLVSKNELRKLSKSVNPFLKEAILKSADNIELFHRKELKTIKKEWFFKKNGAVIGQRVIPVEKVGIYIPGGKFRYFSTILMTVIPARIAGVKYISVATPPSNITPEFAFSTLISKVDSVYRVGGPMAIAAFAYGTRTIPAVDIIAGPGNIFVTEAKKQIYGRTGIDMLAGPSEIAVICDKVANKNFIIWDIFAQIEHDKNAVGYILTDDITYSEQIKKMIPIKFKKQIKIINADINTLIKTINEIAPEHLEVIHRKANYIIKNVKNAGVVFIGNFSPVVLGDYLAGPSHTLPTARTARFSSGLSVKTFLKNINIVKYSKTQFKKNIKYIEIMAETEGLKFHRHSAIIRKGI